MSSVLSKKYRPTKNEEYMNAKQLAFFRTILLDRRKQLLDEVEDLKQGLREANYQIPDMLDISAAHSGAMVDYHAWEHQLKSIEQIDNALLRIAEGSYGYCAESGEEIGIKRLIVQPMSIYSIEEQERREDMQTRFESIAPIFPAQMSVAL